MTWDRELAAVIDHTILDPSRTRSDIEQGCEDARAYGFAAFVVQPYYVPLAAEKLRKSGVPVCSVVSFPFGANAAEVKVREARQLLRDGAEEVDMVMNVSAFLGGDLARVRGEVRDVAAVCRGRAVLKLIIETAFLDDEQIALAASLGAEHGADFIKTSTGYARGGRPGGPDRRAVRTGDSRSGDVGRTGGSAHAGGGATPEAVRIIRSAVGAHVGVKASGGIRTREFALSLLDAGANRLGCSASLDVIGAEKGG